MLNLVLLIIAMVCLGLAIYTYLMKNCNSEEYNKIEELKRRIDELDNDNVEVDSKSGKAKVIVPDIVDSNESAKTSTQSEECKEYDVGPKQKVERVVIQSFSKDEDDEPIKENNGILSKKIKNNDEE